MKTFLFAATGILLASPALADPCEAALPGRGEAFAGPVRYVGDGDSLCVEVGRRSDGATWIEVRLADFNAPEIAEADGPAARQALRELVLNRRVRCVADRRSWDRIVARCTHGGEPIGDLLRAHGVREGGN